MRILLIEDEARLAVMVQQSLRKQGYAADDDELVLVRRLTTRS